MTVPLGALPGAGHGPHGGVSAEVLRAGLSNFASGVTVVTAVHDGVRHAMTATAFCSVSLDPPLVLVCVDRRSRFHRAAVGARGFAVSMLSEDQRDLARHFSDSGRDLATQFDEVPTAIAPRSGAPVLAGCQAWLDCRSWQTYDGGDHTILVGLVLGVGEHEQPDAPLTYHRGRYT